MVSLRAVSGIPGSPENPKILRGNDAKVIGHTIAKRVPPVGHIAAQETEHSFAEAVVSGVTSVMGHGFVHQSPETLDWVQMRTVGRNEVEPDPPARHGQPVLNRPGVMVAGIVQEHMDDPPRRIRGASSNAGRGRSGSYLPPPAQIPACGFLLRCTFGVRTGLLSKVG